MTQRRWGSMLQLLIEMDCEVKTDLVSLKHTELPDEHAANSTEHRFHTYILTCCCCMMQKMHMSMLQMDQSAHCQTDPDHLSLSDAEVQDQQAAKGLEHQLQMPIEACHGMQLDIVSLHDAEVEDEDAANGSEHRCHKEISTCCCCITQRCK